MARGERTALAALTLFNLLAAPAAARLAVRDEDDYRAVPIPAALGLES